MKFIKKIRKNYFLIAFYHAAIASYLVGVSAMNSGCSQLGGLLGGGATTLTDTSDATSDLDGGPDGASLTQSSGPGPYGLKVNPLPNNTESALYGIFDIPR